MSDGPEWKALDWYRVVRANGTKDKPVPNLGEALSRATTEGDVVMQMWEKHAEEWRVLDLDCRVNHPRLTAVSMCLIKGPHEVHRGVLGDEYQTVVEWRSS